MEQVAERLILVIWGVAGFWRYGWHGIPNRKKVLLSRFDKSRSNNKKRSHGIWACHEACDMVKSRQLKCMYQLNETMILNSCYPFLHCQSFYRRIAYSCFPNFVRRCHQRWCHLIEPFWNDSLITQEPLLFEYKTDHHPGEILCSWWVFYERGSKTTWVDRISW